MNTVFVLEHSYELSETGEQKTKLIGVYSSRKKAEKAKERLVLQPGFKDFPDYFNIDEYVLSALTYRFKNGLPNKRPEFCAAIIFMSYLRYLRSFGFCGISIPG